MSSPNFVQISGPQGRVQTLVPGASVQTYIFNPQSLKGTLPGGDLLYAEKMRFKVTGQLTRTGASVVGTPNWEVLAQCFGQVRVYSQFLGEVLNKSLNSVPLLANHDAFFTNGFGPTTRARGRSSGSSGDVKAVEFEFDIPFARNYLTRPSDSCPWMPFFEGGIVELDLAAANALTTNYGWIMTGNWTAELVMPWFSDKQPLIHAPIASRLYRVTTGGPEYTLKGVGSPNGLDGVVMGARLAVLSWLAQGGTSGVDADNSRDNGFYNAFSPGGIQFGTAGLSRIDVPFRDQVSIDAVSAWVASFLADTRVTRMRFPEAAAVAAAGNDLAGFPYNFAPGITQLETSLVNNGLNFWPFIWPTRDEKIADLQKVDGDLSFTATLTTPPSNPKLHLFRTDEVCGFTRAKVMDLMDRMGYPHVERGGAYDFAPKYAGAKRADETTQWGMPLKIVRAGAAA